MRPILVYVDTLNILAIDIAAQMRALVYHQAFLTHLLGTIGKGDSEETGADNKIVVICHDSILQLYLEIIKELLV